MTLAASPASDPRYAVTLGPATLEPTPKYAVSLGPATLEPVESKSSVPVLLMGVSLLAAVAVFSGTLRLGKRGGLSGLPRDSAHSFKTWNDPWKDLSLEDKREAHKLFKLIMRTPSGSPRFRESKEKLRSILSRYGIAY
jgi:hypothetical protein